MSSSGPRVVHLSRFYQGGAGRAALHLHRGLQGLGIATTLVTSTAVAADSSLKRLAFPQSLPSRLRRRFEALTAPRLVRSVAGADPFDDGSAAFGASLRARLPPHDILHLHAVAGYLDTADWFRESMRTPCVWTLHDMQPFTGGCHYAGACEAFTRSCGRCPQLRAPSVRDRSSRTWRRRSNAFRHVGEHRLAIVATSRALAEDCARSSLLGRFPLRVIPNAIDTDVFAPGDRLAARARFGLAVDRPVILFVAHALNNPRKGGDVLRAALARLGPPSPVLLLAGGGSFADMPQGAAMSLGLLNDDGDLAQAYRAADVVAVPSVEESFPLVALEAQACGTPVVCFDSGGLRDAVQHGQTGLVVAPRTLEALGEALATILCDAPRRASMAAAARARALAEFALAVQARRYAELYQDLFRGVSPRGETCA